MHPLIQGLESLVRTMEEEGHPPIPIVVAVPAFVYAEVAEDIPSEGNIGFHAKGFDIYLEKQP